jgi:(p)ppGpp synthase/HD superfamily hydrolase
MKDNEMIALRNMELAPWIQKATALIERHRKVGGNQFRHCLATMTILMDYHFIDSVLLKTAIVHDILEDTDKVSPEELLKIDRDGPAVVELVKQLSHNSRIQTKEEYLESLFHGSSKAKIVKLADRISNLTDLHLFVFSKEQTEDYIRQTQKFIFPLVESLLSSDIPGEQKIMINEMGKELHDLTLIRHMYVQEFINYESIRRKIKHKLKSMTFRR